MNIPVFEINGIGPKTEEFLMKHGIITAEDLLKDGTRHLEQAPGFNKKRAIQVLDVTAAILKQGNKKAGKDDAGKKSKQKSGTDKKSGKDRRNDMKKGKKKEKKKDKKKKGKDKKKGKNKKGKK